MGTDVQVGGHMFETEGGAWVQQDIIHTRLHHGQVFVGGVYFASIADNGTALVTFHSGAVMPHGFFEVAVGGNCKFQLVEGGTITGGTAAAIINRLRASTLTPYGSLTHSGTLTGGTAINIELIPGGAKNFASGGAARSEHEIIGLQNINYTAELVNISGGVIQASIAYDFYEHDE